MFLFGDIVVYEKDKIGVVVKSWNRLNGKLYHEVYIRVFNQILEIDECKLERYKVRHKYLEGDDYDYQNN